MTMPLPDPYGAFMPEAFQALPQTLAPIKGSSGPLKGARLAVKDIFDIEGLVTGAGSPIYASEQPAAQHTALAVRLLLEAGADWCGKTVTDELTYSVAGINAHYGTPRNPAAPERLCGGSSSGSAVAVAAGLADIGLGSDCGGSIRLPASYCGVYSFRPSHSRVAANGCFTLAHSYDTVSWLTSDLDTLTRTFEVLTSSQISREPNAQPNWLVSEDVQAELDPAVADAFIALLDKITPARHLPAGTLALRRWQPAFRVLQGAEISQHHGRWFEHHRDTLGADIRGRFEQATAITPEEVAHSATVRVEAISQLSALLSDADTFLLLPTVPGPAPKLSATADEVDQARTRAMRMLCMAGLAGLPQVTLPWITLEGAPVGLSIIATRGNDEALLNAASQLSTLLAS